VALTDDITDPRVAKALAHPLRLEILRHLGDRTASPSQIAAEIGAPLTNVSYHVRKLRSLGLIKLVRKTPKRGVVEHHYSATPRPTVSDEAWSGTPAIVKEALLTPATARVCAVMTKAAREGGYDRGNAHFSVEEMKVDEEGWSAAAKVLSDALEEILRIHQGAAERLKADPSLEPISAMSLMQLLEVPDTPATPSAPLSRAKRRARTRATA
jgi:DNA-binding transcriptional ArsR family regulator